MNNITLEKSSQDKRSYKVIQLTNKLIVLLIKDKETDKSSACMSINIGGIQDPQDSQGIAHFLEHMLFMGTESHPVPNNFDEFLSMNGGSSNADTGVNQTRFYFDCDNEVFGEALEYFSEFFTTPLLKQEYVEKEINAVNSEFMIQINDDFWRESMLLKFLAKEGHPYKQFSNGSLESLNSIPNLQQRCQLNEFNSIF